MSPLAALSFLVAEDTLGRFGGTEGPDLGRYALVCAVLLSSIGLLAFLFRRVVVRSVRSRASQRSLRVLDVLPLGGRQKLCVVRCYDRTFALGLGDKEVSVVAELDPVIEGAPVRDQEPVDPVEADRAAFVHALDQAREAVAARDKPGRKQGDERQKRVAGRRLSDLLPKEGALG